MQFIEKAPVDVRRFQLMQKLLCAGDHIIRKPCKACDLNAKALIRPTTHNAAEEDDVIPHLFYGNAVILDSRELSFEFGQFMVMRGKKCFRSTF